MDLLDGNHLGSSKIIPNCFKIVAIAMGGYRLMAPSCLEMVSTTKGSNQEVGFANCKALATCLGMVFVAKLILMVICAKSHLIFLKVHS